MSVMDNTPSFDNEPLSDKDNRSVPALDDEAARSAPSFEDIPDAPQQPEEAKRPTDPRAARLAEIAEQSNERRKAELNEIDERFGRHKQPEPEQPKAEDEYVDLKVRRQPYRMTVKERNELLRESFDDDDIKAMSEADRNRYAQFELAKKDYSKEIEALKEQVRQPQTVIQQQPIQQPEQPKEPPKSPREMATEKLEKALEDLEFGVDGARARVIEAQNELTQLSTYEAIEQSRRAEVSNRYDADVKDGWTATVSNEAFASNPLNVGALEKGIDIGMRSTIARYIQAQPQQVQVAFMQRGITPDFIMTEPAQKISALYKDMHVKGHNIPNPAALIRAVGQHVASQIVGNTRPAAQDQHPDPSVNNGNSVGLDRSNRKAAIQNQPDRAGVPRPVGGQQPPPMSEQERAKATIQTEKQKRRGIPVRPT